MINAGGGGCNLLTPYSESLSLVATPCGYGPLTMGFRADYRERIAWGEWAGVWAGVRAGFQVNAPAGFTINDATISSGATSEINTRQGWGGITYWAGGHNKVTSNFRPDVSTGGAINQDGPFNSSYWGILMACGWARCSNPGQISLNSVILTATENQSPTLTAIGSNNLWYQTGHWIWNEPSNPWPLTLAATDISGVCGIKADIDNLPIPGPSASPDLSQWHQCPDQTWTPDQGATVDTREYVKNAGPLPVKLEARNAAGVVTAPPPETLNVDNDPVSMSLSTPDDPNPTVWVGHAVTAQASASVGPSGLGGEACGVDGQAAQAYPPAGVRVDGDGVHTVSCTVWNQAVDPQGNHNSATSQLAVHIDEAPPVMSVEPQNPNDPTGLVVNAADGESGVAGGSIEMARAGTGSWASLPTTFTGSQLQAHFNDAGLQGQYDFRSRSCDSVGNCATTTKTLTLPVRVAASSEVTVGSLPPLQAAPARRRRAALSYSRASGRREEPDSQLWLTIGARTRPATGPWLVRRAPRP